MRNSDFRQWLKGFFELAEPQAVLTPDQLQVIINHLNLAEAVEGELDALNASFRAEIEAFRSSGVEDEDTCRLLTDSLRERVLKNG